MKRTLMVAALATVLTLTGCRDDGADTRGGNPTGDSAAPTGAHAFTMTAIDGSDAPLAAHRGKAMLLVNVASRCGHTPQYAGLQELYSRYKDRGLVVIGIPANDFGNQEPGTEAEILAFCESKYDVTFPMMAKVSTKAPDQAPLYGWLTDAGKHPDTGGPIKWNFTKFLIGPDGKVVARFEPAVKPNDPKLIAAVEAALPQG